MGTLKNKANSILTEKNTKIIPENIKKGVQIFNVTGNCETGGKLNIYTQLSEPTSKDGIWLKTDKTFNNVISDNDVIGNEEYNALKTNSLKDIPFAAVNAEVIGSYEEYIYFFSVANSTSCYKYNTLTDTYTQINNAPRKFEKTSPVMTVGTNIYIFGAQKDWSYGFTYVYKYNVLTDSFSQVPNEYPQRLSNAMGACVVDNFIYLFGNTDSKSTETKGKLAYKYNPETNVYLKLPNLPAVMGSRSSS